MIEVLQAALGSGEGLAVSDFRQQDQSVQLDLSIGESLIYFQGHFKNRPVLPAVVQALWAVAAGKTVFLGLGAFRQLRNLKCRSMILPGTLLTLSLDHKVERQTLAFRYSAGDTLFTEGAIRFSKP